MPLSVTHAILYLRQPEKDGAYTLTLSGLHCVTQDGRMFMPFQWSNPGGYLLERVVEPSWEGLLAMVSKDVEALQSVRAMERIADPHERNLAVLGWIRQHRTEMAESPYIPREATEFPAASNDALSRFWPGREEGWGRLGEEVFRCVMSTGIPQDSWEALEASMRRTRRVSLPWTTRCAGSIRRKGAPCSLGRPLTSRSQ